LVWRSEYIVVVVDGGPLGFVFQALPRNLLIERAVACKVSSSQEDLPLGSSRSMVGTSIGKLSFTFDCVIFILITTSPSAPVSKVAFLW
jgi:hypothetical protein